MPVDLRIGLLIAGAVLVLAGAVAASAGSRIARLVPQGRAARTVMVLLGAALLASGAFWPPFPWTGAARSASAPRPAETTEAVPVVSAPAAEKSEMLTMARAAFVNCGAPAAPTALPDGKTATREQMVEAHATVKSFDQATTIYNQCLDRTAYQVSVQYKSVATREETDSLNSLQTQLHNDAIDRDKALADRFNAQLRIYKARGQN
jgi:hypothetical protein